MQLANQRKPAVILGVQYNGVLRDSTRACVLRRTHGRSHELRGLRVSDRAPTVTSVAEQLRPAYPRSNLGNKLNPLDELAYIILSGQTNSVLAQHAYANLKRDFPRWSDVVNAPLRSLTASIRIGGLSRQKARHIREIARRLKLDFGAVTLGPLRHMSTPEAEKYLCSLPGVGIKSARCVLLYSLKRRVFPADVHCLRIMTRLGWVRWEKQRGEQLADTVQEAVPPSLRRLLHIRLVQHGRLICRSRPRCSLCLLVDCCPSARKP